MLRDIRLEGGGERLGSQMFSCCVDLMARVRASRAHMCSVSSLVTTIWSAVPLGSVSGKQWAGMVVIAIRRLSCVFDFETGDLLTTPARRCKLQATG